VKHKFFLAPVLALNFLCLIYALNHGACNGTYLGRAYNGTRLVRRFVELNLMADSVAETSPDLREQIADFRHRFGFVKGFLGSDTLFELPELNRVRFSTRVQMERDNSRWQLHFLADRVGETYRITTIEPPTR
jgi:hypothetical protein